MSLYCRYDFATVEQGNAENVLELKTKVQCAFQALSKSNRLRSTKAGGGNGSVESLKEFGAKILISENKG